MTNTFAKTGALFYVLWGLLHILAAWMVLTPALGDLEASVSTGRIYQNSVFMAMTGIAVIWIALQFNIRNDAFGYWFNLFLISVADLGFIIFVFLPGYETAPKALMGPALWVMAVAFSTFGFLRQSQPR